MSYDDLHIDIETYSSVDLKKCGVHRYVDSPDFEVMLFGYRYQGERCIIDLTGGEEIPSHILSLITDSSVKKKAFNAQFEIECLSKHFGVYIDPGQWHCTSVHALYLGMPNSLGEVCNVLGMPVDMAKMGVGRGLIFYFCKPCKPTKSNGGRTRNRPNHDLAKWNLFKEYCLRDVDAEFEVDRRLARFPFPAREHELWCLDQRMNHHGILADRQLIEAAIEADKRVRDRLFARAIEITGLSNPNSRKQLIEWLEQEDEDLGEIDSLTKKDIPKILEATDNTVIKEMMALRKELMKTSVKKYHAMQRAICSDSRIRGLVQFYGANRTGRWAGRVVQIQNLPQNKLKDLHLARELVKAREFDLVETLFGSMADTLSQLIRTSFVADEGNLLSVADFSAIEARVIAWLAWCEWRLEVFATHGKIYEASAEQTFKLPKGSVTKKGPYRQKGKITELALGYGGAVNAMILMGALEMGLTEEELPDLVKAWRAANPEIVALWYAVEDAAKMALRTKQPVTLSIAGGRSKLVFSYEAGILFLELPNGRRLAYVKPRIEPVDLVAKTSNGGTRTLARAGSITYEGVHQKTKKWCRIATFGGKLVENITQAIARDCLADSMLDLDRKGVEQLMTVHDEIVAEGLDDHFDLQIMLDTMGQSLDWAPGLLLTADGFSTPYYMKEID